ncbi:MAG: hypothetical protein LBU58_06550, partial [Clostridiales bacterium]|nr:hypothetical protein [Clostridiales bacterium]
MEINADLDIGPGADAAFLAEGERKRNLALLKVYNIAAVILFDAGLRYFGFNAPSALLLFFTLLLPALALCAVRAFAPRAAFFKYLLFALAAASHLFIAVFTGTQFALTGLVVLATGAVLYRRRSVVLVFGISLPLVVVAALVSELLFDDLGSVVGVGLGSGTGFGSGAGFGLDMAITENIVYLACALLACYAMFQYSELLEARERKRSELTKKRAARQEENIRGLAGTLAAADQKALALSQNAAALSVTSASLT